MDYNGERRPLSVMLLFSIISCGVFNFYWLYIVTYELKQVLKDEKINPVLEVIFSIITFGIYMIFWSYKYGKYLAKAQENAEMKPTDNAFIYALLTGFLLFPVTMMLMQKQLNRLWDFGK